MSFTRVTPLCHLGSLREEPFFIMEIIPESLEIDEEFREKIDAALRKHGRLSRTRLLIDHLGPIVKKFKSGTQKRQYFDRQVRLLNQECIDANSFVKYRIKRGLHGGYSFTDHYLRFSQGEDYKEDKGHKALVLDSYLSEIESLIRTMRVLIRSKEN